MISILLVDDDDMKSASVSAVIEQLLERQDVTMLRARSVYEAAQLLRHQRFDLMIVDLNVPQRTGEDPVADGGIRLIGMLSQRMSDLQSPVHIVGLTSFDALVMQHEKFFNDRLWHLIRFSASGSEWTTQLGQKLVHIAETKLLPQSGQYQHDLAIVTALHHVELESVLAIDAMWKQQQFEDDDTLYHAGVFKNGSKNLRVVAAAAVEMGMPATTALAMNVITKYRPRYIAMVGIAAGIKGNFGDVLIATHSWDYGCGKSRHIAGRSEFLPAPSQIQVNPLLKSKLSLFCLDESVFRRIQAGWRGAPAPIAPLSYRMGPVATGAAVIESKSLMGADTTLHRCRAHFC
jgi:CheY-like chemotaxis protein/nucleoside phosphorylase